MGGERTRDLPQHHPAVPGAPTRSEDADTKERGMRRTKSASGARTSESGGEGAAGPALLRCDEQDILYGFYF